VAQTRLEHPRPQSHLQPGSNPRHQPGTHEIKHRHDRKQEKHQHRQHQQCLYRTTGEDPIIHLQHVKRAGQKQQIDRNAEEGHAPDQPTGAAQYRAQLRPAPNKALFKPA